MTDYLQFRHHATEFHIRKGGSPTIPCDDAREPIVKQTQHSAFFVQDNYGETLASDVEEDTVFEEVSTCMIMVAAVVPSKVQTTIFTRLSLGPIENQQAVAASGGSTSFRT